MGKITGFLEHRRTEPRHRPPAERVNDFNDVAVPLSPDEVRVQAARCMDCGVPFCHSLGCPLGNYIPDWNDLVYRGRMEEALRYLEATNPLPEVTGRVCPALCEMSCTLAINDSPVSIKAVELEIIEHGFARGWVRPIRPARERGVEVAVIGSGPAGLAAAMRLREYGYAVTVYEKDALPGGILRYGIPNFKLEKHVLDRRIALLCESGIKFVCGVRIGEDISVRYLRSQFPAMVIAAGAGVPRDVPVPGRELQGIHFAMEYLSMATEVVCGMLPAERCISAHGKRVLVIGGGDTGADCGAGFRSSLHHTILISRYGRPSGSGAKTRSVRICSGDRRPRNLLRYEHCSDGMSKKPATFTSRAHADSQRGPIGPAYRKGRRPPADIC